MSIRKFALAAVAAGAMLVSGAASAALIATLNPMAANVPCTIVVGVGPCVLSATTAAFQAVGFASDLSSTLTIATNTGVSSYMETGSIEISDFKTGVGNANALSNVGTNVGNLYRIFGSFTLTGLGSWGPSSPFVNQFSAAPGTSTFVLDLFGKANGGPTFRLGTATLNNASPQVAFAISFGSVATGSTGSALTSLTAGLHFVPAVGAEGAGGFFQAPTPFDIDLAVGNAGGNTLNTGYSVSAGGVVTYVTPLPGANQGTANVTFQNHVPEPGALALVGLALIGAAVAGRRKTAAQV